MINNKKAWTLLEMMAVMVMIAVLSSFVGFRFVNNVEKARLETLRIEIKDMNQSIIAIGADHRRLCGSPPGLNSGSPWFP